MGNNWKAMKVNMIGLVLGTFMVLVLLISGCVILIEPNKGESTRSADIKKISGFYVGDWILINDGKEAQWVITGWQLRVQNIGTKPVSHIKFRLKIWKNENEQMLYSQVHTITIHLNPQDILTSQTFSLKEKFWYAEKDIFIENKFGWNAEIIQAW